MRVWPALRMRTIDSVVYCGCYFQANASAQARRRQRQDAVMDARFRENSLASVQGRDPCPPSDASRRRLFRTECQDIVGVTQATPIFGRPILRGFIPSAVGAKQNYLHLHSPKKLAFVAPRGLSKLTAHSGIMCAGVWRRRLGTVRLLA